MAKDKGLFPVEAPMRIGVAHSWDDWGLCVIEDTTPSECELCGKLSGKYNLCGMGRSLKCIYSSDVVDTKSI